MLLIWKKWEKTWKLQREAISNIPQEMAGEGMASGTSHWVWVTWPEMASRKRQRTLPLLWADPPSCARLASEPGHSFAEHITQWSPSSARHWPGQWGSWHSSRDKHSIRHKKTPRCQESCLQTLKVTCPCQVSIFLLKKMGWIRTFHTIKNHKWWVKKPIQRYKTYI